MLFSTKAEYGVRLMVELGRQPNTGPVSLNAIAEAERAGEIARMGLAAGDRLRVVTPS